MPSQRTTAGIADDTSTIRASNREKAARVLEELREASGKKNLDMPLCDLSLMADVKRAAEAFAASRERLDMLVNTPARRFRRP